MKKSLIFLFCAGISPLLECMEQEITRPIKKQKIEQNQFFYFEYLPQEELRENILELAIIIKKR